MAGIKEIAKITGLSLATVSRVLNNSTLVSPKTKKKVLEAAHKIDYRPNMAAVALRSGKSKIIGVLVPEINNNFFSSIINGIEKKMSDSGYNIIIAQSHDSVSKESSALKSFLKLQLDGILLSASKEIIKGLFLEKLKEQEVPLVFFDRVPNISPINSVILNDFKGAVIATEHLINKGCNHIVHITGNQNVSIFKRRKEGFLAALQQNALTTNQENCIEFTGNGDKDLLTIEQLLLTYPEIDGFFAYGDESCLHLMNILKILKVNIPNQIKIIGFGNSDFGKLTHPSLSTINQKSEEMGFLAAELLLKSLGNKQNKYSQLVLEPELIIRNSTTKSEFS